MIVIYAVGQCIVVLSRIRLSPLSSGTPNSLHQMCASLFRLLGSIAGTPHFAQAAAWPLQLCSTLEWSLPNNWLHGVIIQ